MSVVGRAGGGEGQSENLSCTDCGRLLTVYKCLNMPWFVPYWLSFSILASIYQVCRLQTGLVHARPCFTHLVVTTNYTLEEN